ncbi:MAG: hypothetical protein KBT03_12005 [Bacteroidales bacterium]|nr:hypothetical protein [Candidatus Scybalousia scybalohippi]
MEAKEILKRVYEESKKYPCADVDRLADRVLDNMEKDGEEVTEEEMEKFWDMLTSEDTTYVCELSAYRYFFGDVVIK